MKDVPGAPEKTPAREYEIADSGSESKSLDTMRDVNEDRFACKYISMWHTQNMRIILNRQQLDKTEKGGDF